MSRIHRDWPQSRVFEGVVWNRVEGPVEEGEAWQYNRLLVKRVGPNWSFAILGPGNGANAKGWFESFEKAAHLGLEALGSRAMPSGRPSDAPRASQGPSGGILGTYGTGGV